ncbi:hypothetical protein FA15DRAFT_681483 [Coprinopsis marcescibilis]|uniref:Integrase core domain-containing protein n=1 Tax=Coprinopsis marcescibilis TaxID=230819 RepID=A0A5C3KSJ7_COPMA|nr:hypothetical protein FA15DRAFT_681483 [Coprinopsis marcescibilis]
MARHSPSHRAALSNNASGSNQFCTCSIIEDIPDLVEHVQCYYNEGVQQKDIPGHLAHECNGTAISLAYIKKLCKKFNISTTRHSNLSNEEKGAAILEITEEDPDFTRQFLKAENSIAAENRHPLTQKQHATGIHSAGPNEEWNLDRHEKILLSMGVGVYGIIDKFSQMELALYAVPNTRDAGVPITVYLRVVKKWGGMPVSSTSDKGAELGQLIPLTIFRAKFQPHILEDQVPSHMAVTSTKNITCECGWWPLWDAELKNILHFYNSGQGDAGFHKNDDFHIQLAHWTWGSVVQNRLDSYVKENQFGTDEMVHLFKDLYHLISSPSLTAMNGWTIFHDMLECYLARAQNIP